MEIDASYIDLLPPKVLVEHVLGSDDFFVWEYYGKGLLSRAHSWIFRKRYVIILDELMNWKFNEDPKLVLDVGCGPTFAAHLIIQNFNSNYVGVDTMPADRLHQYKRLIELSTKKPIEIVRASAESLPFRQEVFDLIISLDVLEHLKDPRKAMAEISAVSRDPSLLIVSLPLEHTFQRLSRIGFILMRIRTKIRGRPEYHYGGNVNSYNEMIAVITKSWDLLKQKFSPLGYIRSLNINGISFYRKRRMRARLRSLLP